MKITEIEAVGLVASIRERIAAIAGSYHVYYAPDKGAMSDVCLAASMQPAASLPNFLTYEHVRGDRNHCQVSLLRYGWAGEPFEDFRDGFLPVPKEPGIGMELSDEIGEVYRVPSGQPTSAGDRT